MREPWRVLDDWIIDYGLEKDPALLRSCRDLAHKLDVLREHCANLGRDYDSIEKTSIVPFGLAAIRRHIEGAFAKLGLAGPMRVRGESSPFITDGGHYILDCSLGAIPDPEALSELLSPIPGIVEHGLFVGLARAAIIAGDEGVEVLGNPN